MKWRIPSHYRDPLIAVGVPGCLLLTVLVVAWLVPALHRLIYWLTD